MRSNASAGRDSLIPLRRIVHCSLRVRSGFRAHPRGPPSVLIPPLTLQRALSETRIGLAGELAVFQWCRQTRDSPISAAVSDCNFAVARALEPACPARPISRNPILKSEPLARPAPALRPKRATAVARHGRVGVSVKNGYSLRIRVTMTSLSNYKHFLCAGFGICPSHKTCSSGSQCSCVRHSNVQNLV
jgi:hypothetical protein